MNVGSFCFFGSVLVIRECSIHGLDEDMALLSQGFSSCSSNRYKTTMSWVTLLVAVNFLVALGAGNPVNGCCGHLLAVGCSTKCAFLGRICLLYLELCCCISLVSTEFPLSYVLLHDKEITFLRSVIATL